jgi:hypothetical protein
MRAAEISETASTGYLHPVPLSSAPALFLIIGTCWDNYLATAPAMLGQWTTHQQTAALHHFEEPRNPGAPRLPEIINRSCDDLVDPRAR